jgi:hypothetical protein
LIEPSVMNVSEVTLSRWSLAVFIGRTRPKGAKLARDELSVWFYRISDGRVSAPNVRDKRTVNVLVRGLCVANRPGG